MTAILVEQGDDGVAVVTLNRPELLNAIDTPMQVELLAQLCRLDANRDVRAILVTGAGRGFSAGYDIKEMTTFTLEQQSESRTTRGRLAWDLSNLETPLVAAVNGVAVGAGAIIATAADLRLGSPAASFKFSAGAYGGANFTWSLPLIIGWAHTKDVLLTARKVPGEEAFRMGLLNRLVPADELLPQSLEVARLIASHPPEGIVEIKRLLHADVGRSWRDMFDAETLAALTVLRPKPPAEIFSSFLAKSSSHS